MRARPPYHERRQSAGTYRIRDRWLWGSLQIAKNQMRKNKKSRPAKKAAGPLKRRLAHKNSATRTAVKANHVELPRDEAPPTQVASPLVFWSALPFAMMRIWLGARNTARA